MRLTCPECLTEYEVADAAVANRTRTLRCAHCGYQWVHAAPAFGGAVVDAASEAPLEGAGEAEVLPAAEDAVEDENPATEAAMAEPTVVPDEVLTPVAPRVTVPPPGRLPREPARPVPPAPVRRGRLVFALLVLVVIAAVFAAHAPLMKSFPASARFFAAFGLH